jgi:hypothetical protein
MSLIWGFQSGWEDEIVAELLLPINSMGGELGKGSSFNGEIWWFVESMTCVWWAVHHDTAMMQYFCGLWGDAEDSSGLPRGECQSGRRKAKIELKRGELLLE